MYEKPPVPSTATLANILELVEEYGRTRSGFTNYLYKKEFRNISVSGVCHMLYCKGFIDASMEHDNQFPEVNDIYESIIKDLEGKHKVFVELTINAGGTDLTF